METPNEQSTPITKSSGGLFGSFSQLLQHSGNILKNLFELAALEAGLAKQSLLVIICSLLVLALLVTSTWLVLMAMLTAALLAAGYSWLAALGGICLLHVIFIICLGLTIYKHSLNINFSATRRQASNLFNSKEEASNDGN